MKKSCVIIGAGIGGLFTGALLSKNGINVTLLEKNAIIGGGLQCFSRNGKSFETGMHMVGGLIDGSLKKICKYLGIYDDLKIHHINSDCRDEIWINNTEERFRIPSGKENFEKRLISYFPHESEGIKLYTDEIFRLVEEMPLFSLKSVDDNNNFSHSETFLWPVDRLINHYVSDPKLRNILAYLNPLYAGVKQHTPAYIHALISVLYINGSSRFIGGAQQLADALRGVIEQNDGRVLSCREVSGIEISDGSVCAVKTADGGSFSADYYISAIHPAELLHMLPAGSLGRAYENRLKQIPSTASAFSVFIDFKPDSFKFIEQTCFYLEESDDVWEIGNSSNNDWPNNFLYLTTRTNNTKNYAETMIALCLMNWDEVKDWQDSKVGLRDNSYYAWKDRCVEKFLDKLEKIYPDFRKKIRNIYSASPLTIRDYYHTKEGSIYGFMKDCENIYLSRLSTNTKISNLLLTGQNVFLHGMCGVPLTAIITAEAILGKDTLLNQINGL